MTQLKVLTYNIHKGKSPLGLRKSLPLLAETLAAQDADLIFLQEVQGRNELEHALDNQPERLAQALGMHVVYGRNAIRRRTDHGNALLSRYPIVYKANQDISDHRLEQRGVLHAQVAVDSQIVHCFVAHLGLFKQSRERQADAILYRINCMVDPEDPIILAGDFNDWTEALDRELMSVCNLRDVFDSDNKRLDTETPMVRFSWERGMAELNKMWRDTEDESRLERLRRYLQSDSFKQLADAFWLERQYDNPRTFPASFPWLRLDRMYQRGFEIDTTQVLKGKPWTILSDHLPLTAQLRLSS